jgi:hypothetical protein
MDNIFIFKEKISVNNIKSISNYWSNWTIYIEVAEKTDIDFLIFE